jgi:hypothetical protein
VKNILLYLTQALVQHPDQVTVEERRDGNRVTLELRVHPDDMGRVIGRQGRVAKSLRTVLQAFAGRHGDRVRMDILE